ncbi:hypothetical protein LTR09_004814 [Extremus antarcticus]|uniref:Heterokaryon incompatibility domain-containing protein n=1 Tax=Extremus antarcticus TaxID=702011 RepID=A0AAJ0DHL0_9PEZI|nr:hypothetical protein LTR09_004814 [Extremus antarcticus]
MRLLDTHTFPPQAPPEKYTERPYAILSHTWTDDEVVYSDLEKSTPADDKQVSWEKIRGAQEKALSAGYDFIWIDTVCIDKSSSAELGEVINSMYRWYERAEICFAYLADVELDPLPRNADATVHASFVEALSKSRWWSRGWTLQELIAPNRLLFYDKHWRCLGDRAELATIIFLITRIHKPILYKGTSVDWNGTRGIRLNDFSVAQRMCWASGRQTTRVEDRAYSLLGILDISLDIRYGEADRAFIRLQETLMNYISDDSILAWEWDVTLPLESFSGRLLAPSPDCFAKAHDIVRGGGTEAFSMSNIGLNINAGLIHKDGFHLMKLECLRLQDPTKVLCLRLQHDHVRRTEIYHVEDSERLWLEDTPDEINISRSDIIVARDAELYEAAWFSSHSAILWLRLQNRMNTTNAEPELVLKYADPSPEPRAYNTIWNVESVEGELFNPALDNWNLHIEVGPDNEPSASLQTLLHLDQNTKPAQTYQGVEKLLDGYEPFGVVVGLDHQFVNATTVVRLTVSASGSRYPEDMYRGIMIGPRHSRVDAKAKPMPWILE